MRILAFMVVLLALGACETVKGAGRDIEQAGGAITDTSAEVQEDM